MRKLAKASYSCGDRVASSTTTGAPQQRTTSSESEKGNATTKSKQIDYFSLKLSHQFDIELAAYLSMVSPSSINVTVIIIIIKFICRMLPTKQRTTYYEQIQQKRLPEEKPRLKEASKQSSR